MIQVLFFGPVADRVGARQASVEFSEGLTWQALRDRLREQYPAAFELVALVAVNGERVDETADAPLADGAEVVFMSPFSGG